MSGEPIKVGDRVKRVGQDSQGGQRGTVLAVEERPSRSTTTGQAVNVELRMQVKWDDIVRNGYTYKGQRTWVAVSAEGNRWTRVEASDG